jgi:hypothetical protein
MRRLALAGIDVKSAEFCLVSENLAFQIRSSWAQFLLFSIFERLDFSTTYVFSTTVNIPTPPASTKIARFAIRTQSLFGTAHRVGYLPFSTLRRSPYCLRAAAKTYIGQQQNISASRQKLSGCRKA